MGCFVFCDYLLILTGFFFVDFFTIRFYSKELLICDFTMTFLWDTNYRISLE